MAWFKRNPSKLPAARKPMAPARRPLAMALEPRVMFDGAMAVSAASFQGSPEAHAPPAAHADVSHDTALHAPAAILPGEIAHAARDRGVASATTAPAHDVLFVDARIADASSLLAHVRAGTEVVYLQQGRDGLQQMRDYLDQHPGADSVQIIAHGNDGDLWLGNTYLSADNLGDHAADLAQIGRDIKAGGDILIYACDTAAGDKGMAFVTSLAQLTHRDIAASSDRTGAGSDWNLEVSTGRIEAAPVLAAADQAGYTHDLALITVTSNADSGAGSLRAAISSATAGDTITFDSSKTITLSTGELLINKNLTIEGDIDGNGTADVTLDANYTSRVIEITGGTVHLDGLVIEHGLVSGNGGRGGSDGNPSGQSGADALGAGVLVSGGTVTITHSVITQNVAAAGGGGGNFSGTSYGGGGGGGFAGKGGGRGGDAGYLSGPYSYSGVGGGGGVGGIGGSAPTSTAYAGHGGSSTGGLGGINATGFQAGGAGATATVGGFGSIGGGGGGSGYGPGTSGAGGVAAGALAIKAGATVYLGSTSITQNLGAGGGGSGGGYTMAGGIGGMGIGAILVQGTLHYETSSVTIGSNAGVGGTGGQGNGTTAATGISSNTVQPSGGGTVDGTYTFNAAPVVANLDGDSVGFTEKGAAVRIDAGGNATVTDTDSANFSGGNVTVSVVANRVSAEDVLGIANQGTAAGQIGVSGSNVTYGGVTIGTFTGGTGTSDLVVSLNASATPASVQALVHALTYRDSNTTDPSTATRTVRVTVNDGDGGTSSAADVSVSVASVNDAPTLSATGGTPTYTENGSAVDLFSGVSIGTVETGQSVKQITLTVGNLADGSAEILRIDGTDVVLVDGSTTTATNGMSVTVSIAGGTATVTIAKAAGISSAAAQTLVDGLSYRDTSDTPSSANRVITLTSIQDTGGTSNGGADTTSTSIAATVAVVAVNDVPLISTDSGSTSFVAGDNTASTPVMVDSGLTVTDLDNTTLSSATVSISGNFHSGEDMLGFSNDGSTMGNITGGYNMATGVLTLTSAGGTATLAQWQSALRSVTYTDTAITPNTATRTVSFVANDGSSNSVAATRTVTVTATDQTPIVTATGGTTDYVGGTAAVTIDSGITVSDLDNTAQTSGTVSIGTGFHSGDTLTFTNNGSTMGNITASYNAATGVLTLTSAGATATDAQWANALSSVTFSSTNTTYGNRTIAFATSDGVKTSVAATDTVDILAPPKITTDSGSASFVSGDNSASMPVAIDAGLTATDGSSMTLGSATVALTGNFQSGEDVLGFANDGSTMGNITASYNATTGVMTLTSAGATATLAQWQSALESVTYTDTAVTPNTATRTVSFTAVDGGGTTSNTATRTITVTATDQTPIVTAPGGTTDYVGGTAAVTIDGNIIVSDLDNTTQSSGTVSIGTGFHIGDTLSFVNTSSTTFGNIVGSYNAATGVLTLTSSGATATDAQWAKALSSVTFSAGSSATPGNRTIDFAINDGVKTSVAATDTVDVLGPPQITTDSGSASFVAGDNVASTPVAIDSGLTVTDGSNPTLASATVALTGNFHAGEDVLSFTNDGATMGNITASYNASTGVLTLTSSGATATLAQWQSALDSVTYTDTAVTPNAATRTVSFTVVDGGGTTSNTATRTITVTVTDQTPIVTTTGGTTDYVFSTAPVTIDGGITVSDLDNTTQSSSTVSIGGGFHSGDILGFTNDGATMGNIFASYNAATGVLTLTSAGATATDTQWANALSSVTFSSTSTSYGNRTIDFATSDGTKTSAVATDTVNLLGLPKVTDVSSTAPDGSYKIGDTITLTVTFDQSVTVDTAGGSPTLLMETGGIDHTATYTSGSGSNTLTFTYTVQAGDASADLDYASTAALALNGGTIRSGASVDAVLTLPATGGVDSVAGQHDIVVDGITPIVVSVDAPANGTYVAGQHLDFTVNYSEAVTVDTAGGTPRIAITLDTGGTAYADYISGSGTTALVFRYTVATGQADPSGVVLAGAIETNGGGIHDGVGNAEVDALHGIASTTSVLVDAVAPTATIAMSDTTLAAGEISTVTITFSEAVNGFSNADLAIANGSLSAVSSTDGGVTWTATFTPTADVTDASNLIVLDNTGVADAAGNAGVGSTVSNNYAIDTTAPQVVAITRNDASPSSGGQGLSFTVSFDEDVSGVDAADFVLATTGNAHATIDAVNRVDGHTWIVELQDVGGTGSLQLNLAADGSGIADTTGNALATGADGEVYVIGGVTPVVLPPTTALSAAPEFVHGNSVSLLTTLQRDDLPTIFFGDAAPTPTFALPVERIGGVLDGLATLSHERSSSLGDAVQDGSAWPPSTWIAPNRPFSVRLPGALDGQHGVLQVSLADGRPLPSWLHFDPVADTLEGVPPAHFSGTLSLQLTVLDGQGHVRNVPLELSTADLASGRPEHVSRSADKPGSKPVATAKPALQMQFGQQRQHGNVDHASLLHHLAVARQQQAPTQVNP